MAKDRLALNTEEKQGNMLTPLYGKGRGHHPPFQNPAGKAPDPLGYIRKGGRKKK